MRRILVAAVCLSALVGIHPANAAEDPAHVVIVTVPGLGWDTLARAQTPALDRLVDGGAVAAVSIRAATRGSTPLRGYLTMGAGSRALAEAQTRPRRDERTGQVALRSSARFENGTAGEAMARRVVRPRPGEIVVPDLPQLAALQDRAAYGTRIGNLGEALARAGVRRAVISAADLGVRPHPRAMRRGAVLTIVDRSGTVDTGTVDGLVRIADDAAYGVETDPGAFSDAVRRALDSAQVVVIEPGEMVRADEFALDATPREAAAQHRRALERTDALIGRVAALLTPRDVLYVIGVSSPLGDPHDHLTLAVAHGAGIRRGWLTSPTTHRAGMVTLTDIAPTVLTKFGIAVPQGMSRTAISSESSDEPDRLGALASLDTQSRFGDRFQGFATSLVVVLLAAIALALAVSIWRSARWSAAVTWFSFVLLAVPTTAYIVRLAGVYRFGIAGAAIVACAITAVLATAVYMLPVKRWQSALVLVALAFAWTTGDLLAGAPLQVNNVFGYSPISAGRFYGNSNIAFAILVATTLIGVFGLLDIRGRHRIPVWAAAVLVASVVAQGLPQFGADFGGVAASVPAILVAYAISSGRRVRLWRIAAWGGAGAAAAIAIAAVDATRPPQSRTHLGRFAADLFSGGTSDVIDVITRKAQANVALLGSAWTWTVPLAVVALVLLVRRTPNALRDLGQGHPMLAAGIAGTLAAGVVGFLVNDTGIWVLGMVLAFVVPMTVLAASDSVEAGRIVSTDGHAHVQGPAQAAGAGAADRPQE